MARELTSAGSGYVWPAVRFWSDGETMQIAESLDRQGAWETMRYQTAAKPVSVSKDEFEHTVDEFVDLTIARLIETGADAAELRDLWRDVRAERADPDVSAWRQMEARLGYDADMAPEGLMQSLADIVDRVGIQALQEVAPVVGSVDPELQLTELQALAAQPGYEAIFDIPHYPHDSASGLPWERGRAMAHWARDKLSIPAGPVSEDTLSGILGLSKTAFGKSVDHPAIALGVRRDDDTGRVMLHFRRRPLTGRRFEAARFLADHLAAPIEDRWLPQTDTATARQKVQRAFATEFLVPIDDLSDFLGDDRTDEAIDEAGERYRVSPLAVRSHLVNHGLISSDRIATF